MSCSRLRRGDIDGEFGISGNLGVVVGGVAGVVEVEMVVLVLVGVGGGSSLRFVNFLL